MIFIKSNSSNKVAASVNIEPISPHAESHTGISFVLSKQ